MFKYKSIFPNNGDHWIGYQTCLIIHHWNLYEMHIIMTLIFVSFKIRHPSKNSNSQNGNIYDRKRQGQHERPNTNMDRHGRHNHVTLVLILMKMTISRHNTRKKSTIPVRSGEPSRPRQLTDMETGFKRSFRTFWLNMVINWNPFLNA